MIEKILNNNLGTKTQILYILNLLSKGTFTKDELFISCSTKEYTYSNSFNGIILLLTWLDIIKDQEEISLKKNLNKDAFIEEFTELLFSKLSQCNELFNFLNNKNIIFEQREQLIIIKNNLILFKFSAIRNLLINIGLFEKDKLISNQYIINNNLYQWFIDIIIPLIEKSQFSNNDLKSLENLQNNQKKVGYEAELFVLKYEKEQRKRHQNKQNIKIISEVDVMAGYDIISYRTDTSLILDKYIEVKSFNEIESFFWSRNEMDIAKQKGNDYFLYLVDRSKIDNKNYAPTIIQNPYKNVIYEDKWKKRIEKYFITKQ